MEGVEKDPTPPPLPFRPISHVKKSYKKHESYLKNLFFSLCFIILIVIGLSVLMSLRPDDDQEIIDNRSEVEEYDAFKEAYEAAKKRLEEAGERVTVPRLGTVKPTDKSIDNPMESTETIPEASTTRIIDFSTEIPETSSGKPEVVDGRPTCLTEECMSFVGKIRSYMDEGTSPCDDFYQHVCGRYNSDEASIQLQKMEEFKQKTNHAMNLVADFLKSNASETVLPSEGMLQNLYEKCANRGDEDLTAMLADVNQTGWPKFEKFGKLYKINDLLKFYTVLDPNSPQLFTIEGHRKEILIYPNFCKFSYEPIDTELVEKIFRLIEPDQSSEYAKMLTSSLEEALQVDRVGVQCSNTLRAHPEHELRINGAEFNWTDSRINFDKILRYLAGGNPKGIWEKIEKRTVFVDPHEFLEPKSIINDLMTSNPTGLAHYLAIKYIEKYAGGYFVKDREHWCSQTIVRSLPRTALSIFVNHFIRKENVHGIPRLVRIIKSEFRDLLKSATWMSEDTVALLNARISQFTSDIGGRMSREDRLLEKIHADETTTFYVMRRNFNRFAGREAMDFVLGEQEMAMDMEETAAKANFNNRIPVRKLLAPMLLDPIFDVDFPLAVQFGRAGTLIGHEMGHVVNPWIRRNQFDAYWNLTTAEEFGRRMKCVVRRTLRGGTLPTYSSTRQTLADFFGIQAAWNAYEAADKSRDNKLAGLLNTEHTDDKLFFYSNVQLKCQKKERYSYKDRDRINGLLSQIPGFQKTFDCPKGTGMNPDREKCRRFF